MNIPTKSALAGMALASMLLAGASLAGAANSATSSECSVDDWNDAPASDYCSNVTVAASQNTDECDVSATCSFTFEYGAHRGPDGFATVTFTPSVSETVHYEQIDNIIICVAPPSAEDASTASYTATVRVGLCNEGEVFAQSAVAGYFVTD